MSHQFKTTNIKGKQYVEVNQRLLYFRQNEKYSGWSIENEIVSMSNDSVVMRCIVRNAEGVVIASAHAQEDRTSSMINKTSYVENCETSAVGRALAFVDAIGVETSIASAEEVDMAIAKQESAPATSTAKPEIKGDDVFQKAVDHLKSTDKESREAAYESIIAKYGGVFSTGQKTALKKFI
jgi:hypothetical protein